MMLAKNVTKRQGLILEDELLHTGRSGQAPEGLFSDLPPLQRLPKCNIHIKNKRDSVFTYK